MSDAAIGERIALSEHANRIAPGNSSPLGPATPISDLHPQGADQREEPAGRIVVDGYLAGQALAKQL